MECLLFTMEGLQFRKTCVRYSITFLLRKVYFMIEMFLCFSLFTFFARVLRLDKMFLLFRGIFILYIMQLGKI